MASTTSPAYSYAYPIPPFTEPADDGEDHVLGVDAAGELSAHLDASHARSCQRQALGGEYVAHLAGADPEGDGAEGAVRRGVAVPAGDRHAGLGEAELGSDHVHDALATAFGVEELDAVLAAARLERLHHLLGEGVG